MITVDVGKSEDGTQCGGMGDVLIRGGCGGTREEHIGY